MTLVCGSLAVGLTACAAVEENESKYAPTEVTPLKGRDDAAQVKLTPESAARADVQTSEIRKLGQRTSMPYSALIYDDDGHTWTFVVSNPYTYIRDPVRIVRIAGDRVILASGPAVGTKIVTTGAAEIYSAEFGVEE